MKLRKGLINFFESLLDDQMQVMVS